MHWKFIGRNIGDVIDAGQYYVSNLYAPRRKMSEQLPDWTTIVKWPISETNNGIRDAGLDILKGPFTMEIYRVWEGEGILCNRWIGIKDNLVFKTLGDALKTMVFPFVGTWKEREIKTEKAFAIEIVMVDYMWNLFCEKFIIRRLLYDRVQKRKHLHISCSDYY